MRRQRSESAARLIWTFVARVPLWCCFGAGVAADFLFDGFDLLREERCGLLHDVERGLGRVGVLGEDMQLIVDGLPLFFQLPQQGVKLFQALLLWRRHLVKRGLHVAAIEAQATGIALVVFGDVVQHAAKLAGLARSDDAKGDVKTMQGVYQFA